jgi:hypothetical protein
MRQKCCRFTLDTKFVRVPEHCLRSLENVKLWHYSSTFFFLKITIVLLFLLRKREKQENNPENSTRHISYCHNFIIIYPCTSLSLPPTIRIVCSALCLLLSTQYQYLSKVSEFHGNNLPSDSLDPPQIFADLSHANHNESAKTK